VKTTGLNWMHWLLIASGVTVTALTAAAQVDPTHFATVAKVATAVIASLTPYLGLVSHSIMGPNAGPQAPGMLVSAPETVAPVPEKAPAVPEKPALWAGKPVFSPPNDPQGPK
jgi:hypothetical protein